MKVTTNGRARYLHTYAEVPDKAREMFDYIDEDEYDDIRFFEYKGEWWDVQDCEPIADTSLKEWHGMFSMTYWSAVLFRYVEDEWGDIDPTRVVAGVVIYE